LAFRRARSHPFSSTRRAALWLAARSSSPQNRASRFRKGSAISLIIDVLCGVLTGAAFAAHIGTLENLTREQNVGHFLAALRVDVFGSIRAFTDRMDELIRTLKASAPAAGVDRVRIPGEPEADNERHNARYGVPLVAEVAEELQALGSTCGVAFPAPRVRL
jgi:L-2-hydroxycarboxylate dehydrogenase (NAD+)